jgi:hypothetical protein
MSLPSRIYDKVTHELRYFLLRRLPTCKDIAPLMSESLERPLALRERVVLKAHLAVCAWCEWYLRQIGELREAARGRPERGPGLSDEARERIRRRLDEEEK